MRYGRRSGRIVPWKPLQGPAKPGDRYLLDLGDYGAPVVTVERREPGDRLLVRLPAGGTLIVRPAHLERLSP